MIDNPLIMYVAFPLAGYVVGSVPFGVLIARARGIDLRKVGSGNVGATNVARALGRKWGYVCFLLDMLKGLVPVATAGLLLGGLKDFPAPAHQAAWLATGFGAIAGHVFPVWLRFRGGKGVATALGVVLGIYPYFTFPGLCAFALWAAVVLTWRYISLGSITAAAAFAPLFAAFNRPVGEYWPLLAFAGAMAAMIIARHRQNIARLVRGNENKINLGRAEPPQQS